MSDPVDHLNAALKGRYTIERELGEGGMATVYLAKDLKHNRNVALKVLKPELAAVVGAERFLAEVQVTANLQHPNILPLHDSGEADGFLFYVMPYVEGDTLKDRLDREHQLPVADAVHIATDMAEALDYAHRQGVIHRDIKPANVLLLEGKPVISDFGIALAVGAAGGGRLTETGLSLGTPHYMSPEQATGEQTVGGSTDTYALGSVLYEMLVGEPPYPGTTAQAVLGKIIAGEPVSVAKHRPSVPANVDAVVRKALEKLPADRFTSAQDLVGALTDDHFRYGELVAAGAVVAVGLWKRLTMAATTLAALFAVAFGWALLRPESPPPVSRHYLSTEGWSDAAPFGRQMALAPDGSSMIVPIGAAGAGFQLGLKMRDATEVTPIPGTENAWDVVYSPDGEWIAYMAGTELFKRPLIGGSPLRLAEDAQNAGNSVGALDWLDDGTILYEQVLPDVGSRSRRISRITEDGGEAEAILWHEDFPIAPIWVHGLPEARGAIVVACRGPNCSAGPSQVHVVDLEDRSSEIIFEDVLRVWYAPTGHLVYVGIDGSVLAQPFDLEDLELTGPAIPLFAGVNTVGGNSPFPGMLLGKDGTLLFLEGSATGGAVAEHQLLVVDLEGNEQLLTLAPRPIILG